ncbi:MAG: response regulator [Candidatus Glassbacteria bacterium]|nr:response regulator [Candidatus Glassbacteria bacterium]
MAKKKILIVDDDEQVLAMLNELLEEEGYLIEISPGGEDALSKVAGKNYHLVISDVRMPGIDGFEVLQRVKDLHRKTKVILMTGYTDDYDISDALILGADDYITKPFDVDKVVLTINNLLA